MTWTFDIKNNNHLFSITVSEPRPKDSYPFKTDGRIEFIDEASNLVRRDNIMFLTRGMITVTAENYDPVTYDYDKYPWDAKTGLLGNTNPYGLERQVYPYATRYDMTAGPAGALWVCFMPQVEQRLSYEAYKGSHNHRCQACATNIILINGQARIDGADRELWEIVSVTDSTLTHVEASDDAFIVYVWERQ